MATATPKITLSVSRDIPFNKLVLSQANVRRIKAGVSVEELAEDIARRTLLQSLTVRPVLDESGAETGMFEIPAGGRRYRALGLLVRQKRLAKTAPVPCVVRTEGLAEEDSLAENVQRAPLHPLDQFRAFLAMREKGRSEEEIAAAFFVSAGVVRQRLRLAAVSPRLLDVYAEDGMTLDQLMAFTVSCDHERQEQVWERLKSSYTREPYMIRRLLTEGAVRASDKRARFVGLDAYEQAGGLVMRDLFQADDGGWLEDVALVDRLLTERLEREAEAVRAEGWRWIEVAPDFPYGHTFGLRQLRGEEVPLTAEEEAAREALQAEFDRLEEEYAQADELPEAVERRFAEIEAALEAFDIRPVCFDPAEVARAGAFVSIGAGGTLRVERGYVRHEDEPPVQLAPEPDAGGASGSDNGEVHAVAAPVAGGDGASHAEPTAAEPEEDEGLKPIPDRLMTELTAHRTLGLRHALVEHWDVAFVAALHALCLKVFYRYALDTCLELDLKSVTFGTQAPGLNDTALARMLTDRHQGWTNFLPRDPEALWDALTGLDHDSRRALFAHCVGLSVNAVHEAWNRRPRALAHADRLAETVGLDMAEAGWAPTVDTYLGRVTKARILAAVREAKGEQAAQLIDHLRKPDMAKEAERLLAGTGWLPEPLRTPGLTDPGTVEPEADGAAAPEALPAFLAEGEETEAAEPLPEHAIAAE